MEGGADRPAFRVHFRRCGVEEERHVVIDRDQYGLRPREGLVLVMRIETENLRLALRAQCRLLIDEADEGREFGAAIKKKVVGRGIAREGGEEGCQAGIADADQIRAFA